MWRFAPRVAIRSSADPDVPQADRSPVDHSAVSEPYLEQVLIDEVDERDSSWEDHGARFRVYFFTGGDESERSWAVETYDVRQADVLEVVQWASEQAGAGRLFAVALVVQAIGDEHPVRSGRGLTWLLGLDANGAPLTEADESALRGMHARRAARRGRNPMTAPIHDRVSGRGGFLAR